MKSWYFPITCVEQKDDHGCAMACVATICGATYERARAEFFPRRRRFKDDDSLCVLSHQMISVARRLGFRARLVAQFKHLGRPAILPFAWSPGVRGTGIHCVVWDPFESRVIDPGYDNLTSEQYIQRWKNSGFGAIAITGKRY